jgi:Fe2+ or Zn2+ uptake regulation protein
MEKVSKRESLICVCAECNKIIKFLGAVQDREHTMVSHGICPECANRLYGDLFSK